MSKGKSVLIVEDEKPLALALTTKLVKEGFDVQSVENGAEALEKLESGRFDVMITDLVMPGTDGFGLLEEINRKKLKIATIVLSNLSQDSDEKRALELGVTKFLVKSDTPLVDIVSIVNDVTS